MDYKCPIDGSPISEHEGRCRVCGFPRVPPNVRAAETSAEVNALNKRYEEARVHLATGILGQFENALRSSSAVVGCDLYFISYLLTNSRALYNNYHMLVKGETLKPGRRSESTRNVVDTFLFPTYEDKIIFGSLSLTGIGLKSYGLYCIKLDSRAINWRATVLEDNSFMFHKKHSINGSVPAGYRANWQQRHKLAVAKLAKRIIEQPTTDFSILLQQDGADIHSDECIEVHIYGPFDEAAIESVAGPEPIKPEEPSNSEKLSVEGTEKQKEEEQKDENYRMLQKEYWTARVIQDMLVATRRKWINR